MVKVLVDGDKQVLVDTALLLEVRGKDGINGKDGANGLPGLDGKNGLDGLPGKDGKDGVDGKDGISYWIEYDEKNNLIEFKNNGGLPNPKSIKLPTLDSLKKSWGFGIGGRGGGSVQSDWNQTDKHSPDYIKNKPKVQELQIRRVDELPDVGETFVLYLVPSENPQTTNIYDEYIWAIQSDETYAFEVIGSTSIDLSDYLKGVQIDGTDIAMDNNQKVNIQRANGSTFGVVKINSPNGIAMSANGQLYINKATDTEIEEKTNNYKPLVPANLDRSVKEAITNNSITLTDAEKKAARDWQGVANAGDLIPDFDILTPIETHTFDMSSTGYYEIFSRPNDADTYDNPTDAQFEVWCRIITTNTDGTSTTPRIYQELDCVFREFGSSTQVIYGVILSKPESVTAASTGIQTIRSVCPKAINSGKQFAVELKAYNNNARTITVQVYKTAQYVEWKDTAVASTYDSNHQTSYSVNAYNVPGYVFLGSIQGTISSASSANTAGYITNSLAKTLASSTLKNTGYAIIGNSLLFKVKGQALLAGIATTNEPIDVNFGVCQAGATAAASSTNTYTYTNYFQKHQFTPASALNFSEAYDNGDLIYARFTLSNGEIYSDDICSKYPTAGHTWYCIGMATSSTAINFDNTESYFFTLDANGKLTHIDGREIGGSGGGSTPVYNSQTNTLEF